MPAALKYQADGRPVFASNDTTWWGYEPSITDRPLTFDEAWESSGIGRYEIVEEPLQSRVGLVTTHKALYLNDTKGEEPKTLLNVVTKDRKTFQPREALALAPAILEVSEQDPVIQTLGMLDNGKIWYATVMFPQTWVINGDEYKGYLFVTDRVNGSCLGSPTPIRIVCGNTYGAAMSSLNGVARYVLPHTSGAVIDADKARKAIGMLPQYMAQFKDSLEVLYSQDFTFDRFLELSKEVFGDVDPNAKTTRSKTIHENRTMELARLWKADTQASTFRNGKGTKATAYHAFGEYLDWAYGSDNGRAKRAITADTGRIKSQIADLLLASA